MLSYVMIGARDLNKSKRFLAPICELLGFHIGYQISTQISWKHPKQDCCFILTTPIDGEAAHPGNGVMVSFVVQEKSLVDAAYSLAIEGGGTSEGAPGQRSKNFYGGYFRDLDGNKFCIHTS